VPFRPHDAIPVEPTFDTAIGLAGGQRVGAVVGENPDFENADYIFTSEQIVIELKEIQTDWPKLDLYRERIDTLIDTCLASGRITKAHLDGVVPIARDVRRDFMQILRRPVKRILEKANRQIRDTHAHFGHQQGEGVLILVLDGLLSVAPVNTMALVCKILLHDYSSISAVIGVTVNEYSEVSGDDYARLLWIPAYKERATDRLVEFVDALGQKWSEHLQDCIGKFDDRYVGLDRSFLDRTSFIRSSS